MKRVEMMSSGEPEQKKNERDRDIFLLLRQIKGVPNKDVSRKAGIAYATIANMRKPASRGGTRYPRHETMSKIAKAFGMRWRLTDSHGEFLK